LGWTVDDMCVADKFRFAIDFGGIGLGEWYHPLFIGFYLWETFYELGDGINLFELWSHFSIYLYIGTDLLITLYFYTGGM
jgi:hypothetical protein